MDIETKESKEEKEKQEALKKEEKKKEEIEPDFEIKNNLSRVTPQQVKYLSFDVEGQRYKPIRSGETWGIVLLKNYDPNTPEDFITSSSSQGAPSSATPKDEGEEPNPPQPFDFDPSLE